MMDLLDRVRFFVWIVSDASLARLSELLCVVPPRTLKVIIELNKKAVSQR